MHKYQCDYAKCRRPINDVVYVLLVVPANTSCETVMSESQFHCKCLYFLLHGDLNPSTPIPDASYADQETI